MTNFWLVADGVNLLKNGAGSQIVSLFQGIDCFPFVYSRQFEVIIMIYFSFFQFSPVGFNKFATLNQFLPMWLSAQPVWHCPPVLFTNSFGQIEDWRLQQEIFNFIACTAGNKEYNEFQKIYYENAQHNCALISIKVDFDSFLSRTDEVFITCHHLMSYVLADILLNLFRKTDYFDAFVTLLKRVIESCSV